MKVSIIIPVKNRLEHLLQCLPCVLSQDYQDIEVIIVDFNCPQNTGAVIQKEFSDQRIKVYKHFAEYNHWNLAESRNIGFEQATGDMILFLDADTIIQPTFIEYAVKELNRLTFVTGLTYPPWNGCGCCLVNRGDFMAVRGYNEALTGWGYEDFDMYKRLSEYGLEHRFFSPDLIVNLKHEEIHSNEYHNNEDKYETCDRNLAISLQEFKSRI